MSVLRFSSVYCHAYPLQPVIHRLGDPTETNPKKIPSDALQPEQKFKSFGENTLRKEETDRCPKVHHFHLKKHHLDHPLFVSFWLHFDASVWPFVFAIWQF